MLLLTGDWGEEQGEVHKAGKAVAPLPSFWSGEGWLGAGGLGSAAGLGLTASREMGAGGPEGFCFS